MPRSIFCIDSKLPRNIRVTGKARLYSGLSGIGTGVITFAVVALLMAFQKLPGMGPYLGSSASDLRAYIGLALFWAIIFALIAGALGWLIGGTFGTLADRKTNPPPELGEGQPGFLSRRGVKVSEEQ